MLSTNRSAEKLLQDVVHELRQPLGAIETSAYLLNKILRGTNDQAYEYLCTIERQVDCAARLLNEAVAELNHLRASAAAQPITGESLVLTKSETAVVT
jgi:signal transduction histidine kinase